MLPKKEHGVVKGHCSGYSPGWKAKNKAEMTPSGTISNILDPVEGRYHTFHPTKNKFGAIHF